MGGAQRNRHPTSGSAPCLLETPAGEDGGAQGTRIFRSGVDVECHAEAILESVRGGALPLQSGPVQLDLQTETPFITYIRSSLEVHPTARTGLYRVAARAGCTLRGEEVQVTLDTMVWQP